MWEDGWQIVPFPDPHPFNLDDDPAGPTGRLGLDRRGRLGH
jgi:hypothetical protein